MEEELKAILLRSTNSNKNLINYFPLKSGNIFKDQLVTISNQIRKYGNGYLQNKDLVYYYKTFTYQHTNISLFCVIYFHFSLKRKYIEKLIEEIYQITNINEIIENNVINENIILKINDLFHNYKSIIKYDKGKKIFIKGIDLIEETPSEDKNRNNSIHGEVNQKYYNRIKEKESSKVNSDLGSTFNNTPFTEAELNFMMRGYNLNKIIIVTKWKKTKKHWLIIFFILGLVLYTLLGLYIYYYIFRKEN